jgi:hypothetical protein
MEGHMVLISMTWLKIKWPRLHYVKKPVNIRMILALDEAEKRMDRIHIALDELRRVSSLR